MRTKSKSGAVAVSLAAFLSSLSLALVAMQDWYVDVNAPDCTGAGTQVDPFCSIQDAVTAAVNGDTIHIAPGTYFENVFLDKDLELIGTGGELVTILDGSARGSVVRVTDATVALRNLTLTNGTGTPAGGGICLDYTSDVTLQNSTVSNNYAFGGGGISSGGSVTLMNSTVSNNGAYAYGGGISGSYVCLISSTVTDNYAGGQGGGIRTASNSTIPTGGHVIRDSVVARNQARSGGGIFTCGPLTMTGSMLADNTAGYGGGIWRGDGMGCGPVQVANSTVTGNTAGLGGGFFLLGGLVLTNSTVTRNGASSGLGEGIWVPDHYASGVVANSILWDNGRHSIYIYGESGSDESMTVVNSIVEGGWPGTGNIDADPLFRDPMNGNYRLMPGSPAINAGDNLSVPMGIDTDIRGLPRIINGTVDMGAYEYFQRWKRTNVPVPFAPPRRLR